MTALMFKANIALYPLFAMCYLLVKKYNVKVFIKQCFILAGMVLCFVIPWSIRNYAHFDAFIPLTYGSGNPMLLGTYQGEGYPEDEELDYEKNVDAVAIEKYSRYYGDNGEIPEEYLKSYVSLEKDGIKARYRLQEWIKKDSLSLINSYLIIKPMSMLDDVFYWDTLWGISYENLQIVRKLDLCVCILAIFLSFYLKKYRKEILFLGGTYLANIYIYSMTFAFSRYAQTLMPLRFIMIGIGCYLFLCFFNMILKRVDDREGMRRREG